MPMSSVRLQHTASRHNTTLVRLQHPPHPLFHQKTFRVVHPHQHLHPQHTLCAASNTAMSTTTPPVEFFQYNINLKARPRGCHVVTREILAGLKDLQHVEVGLANFFIQHTSASLTINENASPDVPLDLNDALDRIVPEGRHYRHLDEGLDDMPAHVKSSLMGPSLTIPIGRGRLMLGTWQGIYLNEHRNHGGSRTVVVTLQGTRRADGRAYGPNA